MLQANLFQIENHHCTNKWLNFKLLTTLGLNKPGLNCMMLNLWIHSLDAMEQSLSENSEMSKLLDRFRKKKARIVEEACEG
jgi:hypothetical protein